MLTSPVPPGPLIKRTPSLIPFVDVTILFVDIFIELSTYVLLTQSYEFVGVAIFNIFLFPISIGVKTAKFVELCDDKLLAFNVLVYAFISPDVVIYPDVILLLFVFIDVHDIDEHVILLLFVFIVVQLILPQLFIL